eukprot:Amastigsp_a299_39.p3 type:complete len:151 gc:universal Amastigsp_a299_39:919-467(-)
MSPRMMTMRSKINNFFWYALWWSSAVLSSDAARVMCCTTLSTFWSIWSSSEPCSMTSRLMSLNICASSTIELCRCWISSERSWMMASDCASMFCWLSLKPGSTQPTALAPAAPPSSDSNTLAWSSRWRSRPMYFSWILRNFSERSRSCSA